MTNTTEVHASGMLAVGDGHQMYWEESGSPSGRPALYLHGGPGGSINRGGYRQRFDPQRFRVVGLDQRGCGRSRPLASDPDYDLSVNTTPRLIDDLEALREHLGIQDWVLNGVSWGSTLALAYAQAHPERVAGIVLMAVTTTDRPSVDWITEDVGAIYPEAWDRLAGHAERSGLGYHRGRDRIVEAYARLLRDPDPAVRDAASHAWADWEDHHVAIGAGGYQRDPRWDDDAHRIGMVTLVTHYWSHDAFLDPPILQRMDRLAGIPGVLIHGRLDVSGPTVMPWRLHQAWPGSELIIEETEGHGGPAMVAAWSAANQQLADRLG